VRVDEEARGPADAERAAGSQGDVLADGQIAQALFFLEGLGTSRVV
jgi:hypothetical protein